MKKPNRPSKVVKPRIPLLLPGELSKHTVSEGTRKSRAMVKLTLGPRGRNLRAR